MSTKAFPALNRVVAGDGTPLPVFDAGPREAPALLFVHGITQSKAVWSPLLAGPLARTRRLVAFDLRGHGDASEGVGEQAPTRARLGEDLAEVMAALRLQRPTIVATSFGGAVVGEYLRAHGDAALGGIVLVAGAVFTGRAATELYGPAMMGNARDLMSSDAAVYAAAAEAFLRGSSVAALSAALHESSLEEMRRVPVAVRRALLAGGDDYRPELRRTTVPLTTLHGERDAVVLPAMSDLVDALRPDVRSVRLSGVGHLPWLEAPSAFLHTLAP